MIDSLLTIGVILIAVVGSGALTGRASLPSPGGCPFSWVIVARSTVLGVILAGAIFALAVLGWVLHHRWAGVQHTMFVIETFSSLALGSFGGWIAALRLSRRWHMPARRNDPNISDRASAH